MTPLTDLIIKSGNTNRILTARQLMRFLGGSDARRYGQVNRALKAGELLKVRRGLYMLAQDYRSTLAQPFVLAQHIAPGSFISAETALSFHSWIPEAVHSTVSMTHGGKSMQFTHKLFGQFVFRRITTSPGFFLQAVTRHELQHQVAFIAEPMRALLDLVYLRKLPWQGLNYLLDGLRIDEQAIRATPSLNLSKLLNVYKGKQEKEFIEKLLRSLDL
jgi:hypothetical protein